MSSPSAVVCREIFDENSQPSAEGLYSQPWKLLKYTASSRYYISKNATGCSSIFYAFEIDKERGINTKFNHLINLYIYVAQLLINNV